jgi:putative SOS response-associated peptidase YedK
MCGAYAAINNLFTDKMTQQLGVAELETRGIRVPASNIQIIRQHNNKRQMQDAIWWLFLDNHGKPNYKYATFNSRWDKLYSSRLTKNLFKTSRCIIPASAFIEGQNKRYYLLERQDDAIAFAGIFKHYQFQNTTITSASIITCPSNPKLEDIHRKSLPLMLNYQDSNLIDAWLDPQFTESQAFQHLLVNKIPHDLIATPIKSARDTTKTGKPKLILAD